MYEVTKEKLKELGQEHLLQFYDELTETEKELLLNEINSYDIDKMNQLYKNSYIDDVIDITKVSPLPILKKCTSEIDTNTGIEIVKNGEYAVVIMAGGNASRLGLNMPKGCLELDINENKISLFELYINQLKKAFELTNTYIHLYIMTNDSYESITIDFFEKNNYFNYPKENIHFFKQNKLPILDVKGKIFMKNKYTLLTGPNGNGDVYKSLKTNGCLEEMKQNNIRYVLFSTIDNILTNLVDYNLIGITDNNNYKVATKTLSKESETERDWIFCKYNNKPFMLPTSEITPEITNTQINGEYVYREKNITYHLVNIDSIAKYADMDLRYHRNYKKADYINESGEYIEATENNSFKFEQFIFDAFEAEDDELLYQVDRSEFFPIKTKEDLLKAQEMLKGN